MKAKRKVRKNRWKLGKNLITQSLVNHVSDYTFFSDQWGVCSILIQEVTWAGLAFYKFPWVQCR
jgi:hypothetical protein